MERKLASIQVIDDLWAIDGADMLIGARILGWECAVLKSEFAQPGEMCVYFEVDSILPEADWTAFLKGSYRIKTKKLRGQIAQGVAKPLSTLPLPQDREYNIGDDVTELLQVQKFELPERFKMGQAKGNFPTIYGIPKTDETRVQSAMNAIEELTGQPYYITQKMDGTSFTGYVDPQTGEFEVCSRNMRKRRAQNGEEECVYWRVALKLGLEEKLKAHPEWSVQGECCGEAIQGNKIGLNGVDLYVFNIYHMVEKRYLRFDEFVNACAELELTTVPIIESGDAFGYTFAELQKMSDNGRYGSGAYQEGIVVRAQDNRTSKALGAGRLSFKVINRNFLLKYDE